MKSDNNVEVEYTAKGNKYEMTKAQAEKMFEKHGQKSLQDYRSWSFPYPNISPAMMKNEIQKLKSYQCADKTASKIIKHFHKSIWDCSRYDMQSPKQFWESFKHCKPEHWKKFYINRLRNAATKKADAFRQDGIMRADTIRDGFTITHKSDCVGYFKPMLAKRLINTYLKEFDTIFCPMNGFSGILLGCTLGANKSYIGQDLNQTLINEANEIANFIKPYLSEDINISLKQQDIFTDKGEYDAMLVCPPYGSVEHGNIEKWNFDKNGNNIDVSLSCDEWIDELLKHYKCKRYVIVVDNIISKYKQYIVEQLTNRHHFSTNIENVIVIDNN